MANKTQLDKILEAIGKGDINAIEFEKKFSLESHKAEEFLELGFENEVFLLQIKAQQYSQEGMLSKK
ncbi:hypothetical protein ES703_112471 [subsurface metagenome]